MQNNVAKAALICSITAIVLNLITLAIIIAKW